MSTCYRKERQVAMSYMDGLHMSKQDTEESGEWFNGIIMLIKPSYAS